MRQVRQLDVELGHRRRLLVPLDRQSYRFRRDRPSFGDGDPQRILHGVLAVPRRQLQDFEVFADGHLGSVHAAQRIVGHTEVARGKQVLMILIVLERTGLADQRVDHVAVVDRVLAAAGQPRHPLHFGARVEHLEVVGVDHDVHFVTDQSAGNRIRVPLHLNRAAAVNGDPAYPLPVIELARRQLAEACLFLGELVGPRGVALIHQLAEERFILLAAGEVATAAQQQRLIDDGLQMSVRRFDVAVLMRLAGVGSLRLDLVVIHQVAIACAKLAIFREVVHRGAEAVAAMPSRHAAQLPERLLESAAERLEGFGEAHAGRLPIRVGERDVIQQVVERLAGDRDVQPIHVREVRSRQVARVVDLRKHDGPPWSVRAAPLPNTSLERPPMRVGKLPGIPVLEPREKRERPQPRFLRQVRLDLRPDLPEGVSAGPPSPLHSLMRGELLAIPILARRLLVHDRPPCCRRQAIAQR